MRGIVLQPRLALSRAGGRDNRAMQLALPWIVALLAAGCSPSLDWRETRVEGAGVIALFPCRPDRHARPVVVAGAATRMEMLVCSAGSVTFAVSFLDLADPATVTPALAELRAAALSNIAGQPTQSASAQVSGMTPNAQAAQVSMTGRLPDGSAVQEQAAFFVKGLRVYQASVIGATLAPEVAATFFAGLKLPS
jgi:hypothetical protein